MPFVCGLIPVSARLQLLPVTGFFLLTLMGRIKGGYKLEKELHDKYNNLNLSGEWFSPCFELINEPLTIK